MSKENPIDQSRIFGKINIAEAYWGPWIPVSRVTTKEKPLHDALKPHIHDVKGKPSVPVRLVNQLTKPK